MHAIRQKCRPKHQVLILKCYPLTTKGAVDVKPNSSELSYLLYYATTRRSKVQKVGAFLENKTSSDVNRARIGNVQVTLQIIAALIEKAPRDLPLYASYVLKILHLILKSNDITMVESSIATFDVFCEHHDAASLSADQEYLRLYEETIKMYASFASTTSAATRGNPSRPVAVRWRLAGLQAIKSVASSEALSSVAGRQLDIIMPALLENIWTDDRHNLSILIQRLRNEEKVFTEKLARRTSASTVRTVDTEGDGDPRALAASTDDADKLAEEDIGVLAMRCLKQIFVGNNRFQIRAATISHIKFVSERVASREAVLDLDTLSGDDRGWATTILMLLARWTPVQDRYVILVTAMDSLVRSPVKEQNMHQQVVLATMIDSLFRSDINLIGLSVMDVLQGLIQHILRLLQLNGSSPLVGRSTDEVPHSSGGPGEAQNGKAAPPTSAREQLLVRLEQCIGDLATHTYYADQVSDMIAAILLRLKPPVSSAMSNPAVAIEDPYSANNAIAASANISEDFETDGFFSFDTAKITALSAIKTIILVATRKSDMNGTVSLGRNRVGLKVWEGTQWLLQDPDGRVRKAYADALLTWLEKEMTHDDLKAFENKPAHRSGRALTRNGGDDSAASLARRAVSNASRSEKTKRSTKTSFLQFLHLAIYENALEHAESESDVLLLHLLLTTLVNRLGVNAVSNGLPMIFRLQEDIQDAETIAKMHMGSLCHGYFWMVTDTFDFESSGIGHEIQDEIRRRREKDIWVNNVRLPPIPLDNIGILGNGSGIRKLPLRNLESESLTPFDDRETMVELISISYSETMASPPSSPPISPGRNFNHPILSNIHTPADPVPQIPNFAREAMLSDWSRELVLAQAQASSKTESLAGSRAGTHMTGRNFLGVLNDVHNGTTSRNQSPPQRTRPSSQTYGAVGGQLNPPARRSNGRNYSPAALSDSSRNSIARVDHLKRVLSGQAPPTSQGAMTTGSDGSSESMVSYDGSQSEFSMRESSVVDSARRVSVGTTRSKSRDRKSNSEQVRPAAQIRALSDVKEVPGTPHAIPPVPPLPTTVGGTAYSPTNNVFSAQEFAFTEPPRVANGTVTRGNRSRGGQSSYAGSIWASEKRPNSGGLDLESLLKGIDTKANGRGIGNVAKPPY